MKLKRMVNQWLRLVAVAMAVLVAPFGAGLEAKAQAGPVKGHAQQTLPADLFARQAPPNPIGVGEARLNAHEGKPVALRGQIGGVAQPFADKYAMFLLADMQLKPPAHSCASPWDFCSEPREKVQANLATIRVVDATGNLFKVSLQGVNGLQPLSEVVVQGTVAKRDQNVLIVNASAIFVNPGTK